MKLHHIAVSILFLVSSVHALAIDLSVNKSQDVDILYFSYNDSAGLKSFSTEIMNNGSQPYYAQASLGVDGSLSWSERKLMFPGSSGNFKLYWLPEKGGNYTAVLKVYYGGNIQEKRMDVYASKHEMQDVFSIHDATSFRNHVEFYMDFAIKDGLVVMPMDTGGSIMPQRPAGTGKNFLIFNGPEITEPLTLYVAAINEDYAGIKTVMPKKAPWLDSIIRNFAFSI